MPSDATALRSLRSFFGSDIVSYEASDEGDYYVFHFEGNMPLAGKDIEENTMNRLLLSQAMSKKLAQLVGGKQGAGQMGFVSVLDESGQDYSRYSFKFEIGAESMHHPDVMSHLQQLEPDYVAGFTEEKTLRRWLIDAKKNVDQQRRRAHGGF